MHTVKIAVHSAEGCCTATTMALTSSKQNIRENCNLIMALAISKRDCS